MSHSPFAFATLLTTDSYLPGALTLAAALRDVHVQFPAPNQLPFKTVCLVTPETVDVKSIKALRKAFDIVVGVEVLEFETNERGLSLLGTYDGSVALSSPLETSPVLLSTSPSAYQSPLRCNLSGTPFWAEYPLVPENFPSPVTSPVRTSMTCIPVGRLNCWQVFSVHCSARQDNQREVRHRRGHSSGRTEHEYRCSYLSYHRQGHACCRCEHRVTQTCPTLCRCRGGTCAIEVNRSASAFLRLITVFERLSGEACEPFDCRVISARPLLSTCVAIGYR